MNRVQDATGVDTGPRRLSRGTLSKIRRLRSGMEPDMTLANSLLKERESAPGDYVSTGGWVDTADAVASHAVTHAMTLHPASRTRSIRRSLKAARLRRLDECSPGELCASINAALDYITEFGVDDATEWVPHGIDLLRRELASLERRVAEFLDLDESERL